MTAQIAAYGRLGRDPRQHETKSGKPMASASLAVTVEARERGVDDAEGTLWLPEGGSITDALINDLKRSRRLGTADGRPIAPVHRAPCATAANRGALGCGLPERPPLS